MRSRQSAGRLCGSHAMKILRSPGALPSRPPCQALWLAGFLSLLSGSIHAADPGAAGQSRPIQRLESPEGWAALAQSINTVSEQATARNPRKPKATPQITTLTALGSARPVRPPQAQATPVSASPPNNTPPSSAVANPATSRRYITARAAELASLVPPPPLPDPQHVP